MPYGAVNTLKVHDALHDLSAPLRCLSWVRMQTIPALGHLVLVEFAAKAQVPETSRFLLGDHLGIPLGVVDVLPCRERCAHGGPDQKSWLLLLDLRPRSFSHVLPVEVLVSAVVVVCCQVERKPWEDAEAGTQPPYC